MPTWEAQPGGDGLSRSSNQLNTGDGIPGDFGPSLSMQPLQNWQWKVAVAYAEPLLIGQGPLRQPMAPAGIDEAGRLYLCNSQPYNQTADISYWSPSAPTRRDTLSQRMQTNAGQSMSGTAPIGGIYTGVGEFE